MISKTKVEHIICLALNGFNIVLYLLIIVAIVFKCLEKNFADIVLGIYGILAALILIINEFREFTISYDYFKFLATFRGRGLVMVFFGCLVLDTGILNIVAGTLVLATGLFYIIMSFLSTFPSPNPITINWRNWNDFSAEGLDLPKNPRFAKTDMHERLTSHHPYSNII